MAWKVAYEVDWRDAFASLGATSLNSVGSSFTYEGITWKTPSVARGNPFDQVACVSWGLEAGGLRADSPNNSRFVATNQSAPHVYATLLEIGANSATPFVADPTRMYLAQGFLSSFTDLATFPSSGAAVGVYKVSAGGIGPNQCTCFRGRSPGGLSDTTYGTGGTSAAPASATRDDLTAPGRNVLAVQYKSGARINAWAADWPGGDWPDNADLNFIGALRDTTEFAPDLVQSPETFRVAAAIHNGPNLSPNAYDSTFQRFRLLQWE